MNNTPTGTAALTDLQKNLYRALIERRYYNEHSQEPTVYAAQRELAQLLNAKQSDISNGLKQLTARQLIAPAWTPRKGKVALYLILADEYRWAPAEKYREMQHALPGKEQTERMETARYAAGPVPTRTLRTGPDDFSSETEAEATAATMRAELPDLEGYPDEESPGNGPQRA